MLFLSDQLNDTDYYNQDITFVENFSFIEEVKQETDLLQDFVIVLMDHTFTKEIPLQFLLDNLPQSNLLKLLKEDTRFYEKK